MSFISANVLLGNHGKVFGTKAKEVSDLKRIEENWLKTEGIKILFSGKTTP